MPSPTPELGLQKALDSDDNADYLDTSLANSLTVIDSLFNNVTGHTHGDVHQGGPISTIPSSAIPDGSITSAKITDGSIQSVDLADGAVTTPKLADAAVTTPKIASGVTLAAPTLNNANLAAPSIDSATITNPNINGTITGSPIFNSGPQTSDWFRVTTNGQGIYNSVNNNGIGFDSVGPFVYGAYGGGHVITETATQTLTNKTLTAPQINNAHEASPTLSGTVSGTPTWASPQNFPAGSQIGGQQGVVSQGGGNFRMDSGSIFFNAIPNGQQPQIATNFNAAFATPPNVVACLRESSSAPSQLHLMGLQVRGINTNGFYAQLDNASGGTQSVTVDWIAFGQ